ncbi:MAG TPA: SRPBCC family protein [Dehalococcoidia bacterium]
MRRLVAIGTLFGAEATALWLYLRRGRAWVLRWGASAEEAASALPGDDLVAEPAGTATRAIAIDAPPEAVWPWIAQIGQGRGGAYTYDWIENLLGLGMHSADRILPAFQHPAVGDVVLRTRSSEMRVQAIALGRFIVAAAPDGSWSWAFVLQPLPDGRTRFLSRNRWPRGDGGQRLTMLLMEPASLLMERKMLLNVKQRAERERGTVAAARGSM